jgi:undecaprenyl-diphosphatase
VLQSVILGIIQGVTEFLPISSSAHLILIPIIFNFSNGVADSLFFDVSLHFGTFLSVIIFFFKDWVSLLKSFFTSLTNRGEKTADEKLFWYIFLATLPAAFFGVIFEDAIELMFHSFERISMLYIATSLTLVSFVMIFSEKHSKGEKTTKDMSLKDAMIIGAAQALALFPGVSRSGITISVGLFLGYRREESAKFSFLLSTPVIFGAFLLKFINSISTLNAGDINHYIIGTVTSAAVGYIAIKFLMDFLKERRLNAFAYYRIALSIVLVILFFSY